MTRPSWIGQTLDGRYRIDDILGQGGMSAVYKAFDPNLKRVVAVKMIHAHLADDPKFVVRFMEEAAAVAQLRHPNIVQVYDFNHDDNLYYMVQEFVEGETLQERLRRLNKNGQRMPLNEAIGYILDICNATGYAHQRGLIHRDIKPANIMLDPHGQAILMDFGIVKITGGEKHTETGAVVGTALYLPPELIVGETPDPRSDEYSLAITLFEAVSGRPPFEADSAMTLMMMHLNDPVPDLRQLRTDVPSGLIEIISKALSKKRENRYPSMVEFAGALRGILALLSPITPAATLADQSTSQIDSSMPVSGSLPLSTAISRPPGVVKTFVEPPAPVTPVLDYSSKPIQSLQDNQPSFNHPSPSSGNPVKSKLKLGLSLGVIGTALLVTIIVVLLLRPSGGIEAPLAAALVSTTPTDTQPAVTASPSALPSANLPDGNIAVLLFDDPCLAGPDQAYPVLTQLEAGQALRVIGISPDEVWWAVEHPADEAQTCWLLRSRSDFSGDLSTLPLAEVPPLPVALSVQITGVTMDDQDRYVVEFNPLGFTPALPGTHIHFFFDTFSADQAVAVGGKRLMFGGASPFTGFTQADRPPDAKQLCALVANPDHSVIDGSGNCSPLPGENTSLTVPTVIDEARSWPLAFQDSFADNQNNWPTGLASSSEYGSINRQIENGRYQWEVIGQEPSTWWAATDQVSARDFYLAATVQQVSGSEVGEVGLIFRKNTNQDYLVYKISLLGRYALYQFQDMKWTALIDWSDTGALLRGVDNRMEVIAQGSTLYLVLNGDLIAQYNQAVLSEGQAGLFVGTSNSGDAGVWEFDDFEIRLQK
jgi:serine/threonine protein kinase